MEVKARILQKTQELFNRYGIRSVSMDDIAAQVGISKKTVYQYYADKDELVEAVFDIMVEGPRSSCELCRMEADNAIQEVFLVFDRTQHIFSHVNPSLLFDMEKYHPKAYRKFQEFRNGFLYHTIKSNLEKGVREELYRADIDTDVLTRLRLYTTMLSFNTEVFPNNRTALLHIETQLIDHFLYGLATPKGQKLVDKYKQQRTKKEPR